MGLKLRILEWWTPKYIINRELRNVSEQTTEALKSLLSIYGSKEKVLTKKQQVPASTEEQRAIMAQTHTKLVEALEATVGHEKAIELGRESLFVVGVNLGRQIRNKLGVSENPKDLIRAAKILYRVLGIEFHLQEPDNSNPTVTIDRCALAKQYSQFTCEVLSATDEGVIKGLQPNATMKFKKYMTSGYKNCEADIHFGKKESIE